MRESLVAAEERHRIRQLGAEDAEMNGYLNPTFLPLWGSDSDDIEDSEVGRKVAVWAEYETDDEWEKTRHEELLTEYDYLLARSDFQKLYHELLVALDKPRFVVPDRTLSSRVNTTDMVGAYYLHSALMTLADSYNAEGRTEEAFAVIHTALRFCLRLRAFGGIVTRTLGDSLSTRSIWALTALVSPMNASKELWSAMADLCLGVEDAPKELSLRLEDMMAADLHMLKTTDHLTHEAESQQDGGWKTALGLLLWRLLGLSGREERFHLNGMTQLILQARAQNTLCPPKSRLSLMGPYTVPDGQYLGNIVGGTHRVSRQLLGLGLACALIAYRLEHGVYPDHLESLGLNGNLEFVKWNRTHKMLHVRVDRRLVPRHFGPVPNSDSDTLWMFVNPTGWTFFLE